jgi:hypothetical protein
MVDHCNLCTSLKQSPTLSFHLALNDSELEDPVEWLWLHSMIGLISVQLSLCHLGTFQCPVFIPELLEGLMPRVVSSLFSQVFPLLLL